MRLRHRLIDVVLAISLGLVAPVLYLAGRFRWNLRWARAVQDRIGVTIVKNQYYEPVFTDRDLKKTSDQERFLPGIDMNIEGQRQLLERFRYADELLSIDSATVGSSVYHYRNPMFSEGDADALYCFVREFKPQTIIEIGCGQSSIVTQLALRKNKSQDPAYVYRHICYEPFHNGWLSDIGAELHKQKIEDSDLELFKQLQPNDIVFIDSTHVLRPQGDVEHEFLRLLPILPVGVLVHIHDIFTPRDYIDTFLRDDRRFWTEQYMLEAFLTLNPSYEAVLALNDMHTRREPKLYQAFPALVSGANRNPGSFWIRRRA
jgi:hypothetical protein